MGNKAGKEDHGLEGQAKEFALYLAGIMGPLKIFEHQNNDIDWWPLLFCKTKVRERSRECA